MSQFYVGEQGVAYLSKRADSSAERVQQQRASMFADVVKPDDRIVDFGCGTGGILLNLHGAYRAGIEVSDAAAQVARNSGIEIAESASLLPAKSFDLVISFHAIEHVDDPLKTLESIGRLAKPNGRIRLIVPCETPITRDHRTWTENDYRHLHSWTPLTFGNLAQRAGYRNIQTRLVPMPSGSRLERLLAPLPSMAYLARLMRSISRNRLNVVLDALPPLET